MATRSDIGSATDFAIPDIIVEKEGKEPINIRNNMVKLDIFENIELPYLTGYLTLKDDAGFYDRLMDIDGTEKLTIRIGLKDEAEGEFAEKEFIINSVQTTAKTSDQVEILHLKLLEKHAFDAGLIQFSKSYQGNPVNTMKNIFADHLNGKEIDEPEIQPIQSDQMKYLVPYLTPIQAAERLRDRANTSWGFPYMLYSTLKDEKIQFKSLEELLKKPAWNKDHPFRFSQSFNQDNDTPVDYSNVLNIIEFVTGNNEDTLRTATAGAVNSEWLVFDATTGQPQRFSFNVEALYEILKEQNILGEGTSDLDYSVNTDYKIGESKINDKPNRYFSRSIMTSTYDRQTPNFYSEEDAGMMRLDAVNMALRNLLFKQSAEIKVGGAILMANEDNRTIGKMIEIFYTSNTNVDEVNAGEDFYKDKKRSGRYMVYSAHHSFFQQKHEVSMTIVKLGSER